MGRPPTSNEHEPRPALHSGSRRQECIRALEDVTCGPKDTREWTNSQDGAANGNQRFSSRDKSSVRGGWLPTLTSTLPSMPRPFIIIALMALLSVVGCVAPSADSRLVGTYVG